MFYLADNVPEPLLVRQVRMKRYLTRRKIYLSGTMGWHTGNQKSKAGPFSNSSGFNGVFEKLCFCDGLVWTIEVTVETRLFFIYLFSYFRRGEDAAQFYQRTSACFSKS